MSTTSERQPRRGRPRTDSKEIHARISPQANEMLRKFMAEFHYGLGEAVEFAIQKGLTKHLENPR